MESVLHTLYAKDRIASASLPHTAQMSQPALDGLVGRFVSATRPAASQVETPRVVFQNRDEVNRIASVLAIAVAV